MPFIQRIVEPKFVCRRRVWPKDGEPSKAVDDELESVVNVALSGTLRQLASLASHADALFTDLRAELEFVKDRTKALRTRMDSLEAKVQAFNPRMVSVPEGDISEFSQRKEHFLSVEEVTTGLFTPDTRPPSVKRLYEAAALAAAAAAAKAAEAVAAAAVASVLSVTQAPLYGDESDSIVITSHTLHTTTTTVRNTTTFVESSWSSVAASRILAKAAKRLRNLDIETRTPASFSQLRRWTSTEALGSPTVSLGAQTIEHNRRTMPPDAIDTDTVAAPPEDDESLPDHRLPSPEEQVNAVAMRFQPELVAVDVSGRAFDRMALFRRSLTHVNCPPEEDGRVRRRTKGGGKKGKRRKRRNTIAGTGDRELREALEADEPSTSAATALENSRASAGESTDIPDAEATSIGMSSTASSAPISAIDKKSHFENIRQWTRSKLRGSMAAVRARSVGRDTRTEDSSDQNHYEVIRRRERTSTSLPISTLSGAMNMAVKLRQGAARRAVGGLSGVGGSRSSSVKGQVSGDAAVNSSSGNWSGTSSARASLESEETGNQQHIPKAPTPAASLSTAPASTTTSCSAATSSASSTASSSGGSSATNSLGRRDSTSTASFTGQSRRRYDSRMGPASSSSSAPHSSSTARAMSTSSEGTLTPDLVTIPFADDGETSSVYSCDTEGYYTSFHMDSGLKTLREEEAATVAALIANAGLGVCNSNGIGVNSNNSSAIAENEYELFGKGSTSTTTSSAGTVCTTLMVRDRPAVPPRQSSLDSDLRQAPSRTASSFDLDTVTTQTTITKAVVHAMPDEDGEDVDSGHNTTSSSSASSSPSTSPVEQAPATNLDKEVSHAVSSNGEKSENKWGTGWNECDYEFSESDLEGVERLERIRVKTTINSSRIPSMCVITPPQSDDEGGVGKVSSNPSYNTVPRSPKGQGENNLDSNNSINPANGMKAAGSLDNLSKKLGTSINNSSKQQNVNINPSGYATVKNIESKDSGEDKMKNNGDLMDEKVNIPISEKCEGATSSQNAKMDQQPSIKSSSTKPFNIMGMVKGVLSSAGELVKSHSKSGGSSNMESTYQSSSQIDYDKDGEYVTIAEVEKERSRPIAPVTTAKMIPAFREMEYVSLNELTPNPTANQQPLMQSNTSSPASSLERNRRRQGARVTLDAEGRVVYSSDSLTRRWKNGKAPTSTFEPGPHVRSGSPAPASPLPNRVPKSNIRPVNSSSQHNVTASKQTTLPTSPLTSPTHLGRRLIIRPGNQQQSPVVEAVPTKAAVTALPGPVSPKLPHQGAYVNMQTRSEQLHGGSPSPMRSPIAGGSWLQPAHIHPMQKQLSPSSSLQPWPYHKNQTPQSDTLNQHPNSLLPSNLPNPSQAYWTLPSRRVQENHKDTVPRSSTPNSRERQSIYSFYTQGVTPPTSKSTNKFFNSLPPSFVSPPLPYHGNIERQQIGDPYGFKSPTTNSQPPHRWLIDSNHNVMHSAAPTSSTPTSKYTNSLPRHFEGMSPIKSPTTHNDPKNYEFSKQILTTFSAQNGPVRSPPPTDDKLKDVSHSPLFTPKTTMPSDELFALIHRSKKKMNIRTDLDSPVRSGSPASHSSLSPGSSESSLTGIQPPKGSGTRSSWSPQEGSCNPSSPPIVNGTRSSPGSRLSWAGNTCSVTPPTSRTDFKRLLLQQRHGGSNRVSAAERLKVGKFGGTLPNSSSGNYSTLPMNGSPRCLNLLPMNSVVTPRNRINSARRFASPRTDVLSSPIPEDKDEEEIGNETKTKKNTAPTHLQNGIVNNELKNSLCHKADNSFIGSQKNVDSNKSNGGILSFSNSSLTKSQPPKINEQGNTILSNHITKSILHSPSPTLGALMNKQKRQSPSPNSSLGPSVKSILEAIQVSKAKSSSKVALETAL